MKAPGAAGDVPASDSGRDRISVEGHKPILPVVVSRELTAHRCSARHYFSSRIPPCDSPSTRLLSSSADILLCGVDADTDADPFPASRCFSDKILSSPMNSSSSDDALHRRAAIGIFFDGDS